MRRSESVAHVVMMDPIKVDLAFQVSGRLIELPIRKGQDVTQGELLGRLDPRDFENTLATRRAALTSARADYERIKSLAERGMAAEKETIDSQAAYDAAVAQIRPQRADVRVFRS